MLKAALAVAILLPTLASGAPRDKGILHRSYDFLEAQLREAGDFWFPKMDRVITNTSDYYWHSRRNEFA